MDIEAIASQVVDTAVRVHMRIGPGMLESTYEACMAHELTKRGLAVKKQVPLPLQYDDLLLEIGYRLDLLVEDAVVVEVKSVTQLLPVHTAQLLSYLRAGDYRLGFLLNFNTAYMRNGIKRLINDHRGRTQAASRQLPKPELSGTASEEHLDLGI
jgi:GxxExxY protein